MITRILRKNYIQLLMVCLALPLMHSCSCNSAKTVDDMLDAVANDNSMYVMVGNINQVFGQLDVDVKSGKIELPEYMRSAINKFADDDQRDMINDVLDKADGIDYTNVVIAVDKDENDITAVFVFGVDNPSKFAGSLAEISHNVKEDKIGEFTAVTYKRSFQVLIKDNLGYVVFNRKILTGTDAADCIKAINDKAASAPLAAWKRDYLKREASAVILIDSKEYIDYMDAAAGIDLESIYASFNGPKAAYQGHICILDNQTLSWESENLDESGNVVEYPYSGKFDTSLMGYASPTDFVGLSLSLNREGYEAAGDMFNKMYDAMMKSMPYARYDNMGDEVKTVINESTEIATQYLSDGGAFLSLGFADGVSLGNDDFMSPFTYHAMLAASLKPEKASEAYDLLCSRISDIAASTGQATLSRQGNKATLTVKCMDEYDYMEDTWTYRDLTFHIELRDNKLIIDTDKISQGNKNVFNTEMFAESGMALQIFVNDRTPVVSSFGLKFGVDLSLYATSRKSVAKVSLTDVKTKFVPTLLGFMTGTDPEE